ncbi:MAG: transposase [Clostridiales bacterium]|nr:transposase [Clostridiales bacterium]
MKQYDTAFKREVCKRIVEDEEKVSALSEELGIHENTLYKWSRAIGRKARSRL